MVRNFNELVLQQARKEDRVDRLGKQKAKEILDKKRERQVGLHRTGELFEPITKRLDIAHDYRKGIRTKEEEALEKARKEEDNKELIKLIEDAVKKHPVVVEGPGAEGVVIKEPGVGEQDIEDLKKMLEKAMGREGGVTEKRLGELIDQSFQDIKNQVEAKPGGVSEERLEQMKNEYVNELNAAIASIKIPSGITEKQVKKIVDDSTKEMKDEIKNVPGGITRKEVEEILEDGTKRILDRLENLEKASSEETLRGWPERTDEGIDPILPEGTKSAPGSPEVVSPSQQPSASTPTSESFVYGSPLLSRREIPSSPPPGYTTEPEGLASEVVQREEQASKDESEETDTEGSKMSWQDQLLSLKTSLSKNTAQNNISAGKPPFASGKFGGLPKEFIDKLMHEYEIEKGGRTFNSIIKDYHFINIIVASGVDKGKTRYWIKEDEYEKKYGKLEESKRPKTGRRRKKEKFGEKPTTGSGLDDSLTESQRLEAFAIVKRNIGSANAGNTSKQSVQQTINAIQLLFLTNEITNQQRISLLQKLKSAINK